MITSRRSFLIGFGALIAAPAIVRAGSLMPVKQMVSEINPLPVLEYVAIFGLDAFGNKVSEAIPLRNWESGPFALSRKFHRIGGVIVTIPRPPRIITSISVRNSE